MAATVSNFRITFPAFTDTSKFPNAQVQIFLNLYAQMVNAERWGEFTDLGIYLAVAHNLVLEAQSVKAASVGGTPGNGTGVVTAKSADKLSTSYDVNVAAEQGAGFWNQTTYGQRYWHYTQLFGMGAVQTNTPGDQPAYASGAWYGVYTGPF